MQLSSFSLYAPSRVIIVITSSIRHSNSCTDGPFSVSRDLMKGGDNTSQLKTSTLDKNKKTIRIEHADTYGDVYGVFQLFRRIILLTS